MSSAITHAVIVNYRTPDLTARAIERLRAGLLDDVKLSVTVVDNGSADGSAEWLQARFPDLDVLVSVRNLGFAGGNNLALRRILATRTSPRSTEPEFVLLLNSDVEVQPDTVSTLTRFLVENPDAGIVGPKIVLPDGRLDLACRRGFPTPARAFWKLTGISRLFPRRARFTGYNLTHLPEDETADVDSVVGACMLLRVEAIESAGLLDEHFFMYGEDLDWAYRIKQHGWRVVYYPTTRVVHLKGATTRRQSYRMIIEFYRAMWLFHRKHYASSALFLINWLVLAGIVARGTIAMLANAARPVAAKRVS
ncbi:MAG TPA: glycosyltransferase family 2 protein [Thermomicrobiales bacterium]|nr:glycosyltransferase family 2 protein [Thermomicrobiales bacterium]